MIKSWRKSECSPEEIDALSSRFVAENVQWHFHVLVAPCALSDDSQSAFILEHTSTSEYYVSRFTDVPTGIAKAVSVRQHGEHIMQSSGISSVEDLPSDASQMISSAQHYSQSGIPWHHHVLPPGCKFNPKPLSWSITLESGGITLTSSSAEEPKELVHALEVLFYSEL